MLRLLQDTQLRELRKKYYGKLLFCSLFPALSELERMYGELSATQVWEEAVGFCDNELRGMENGLDVEVIELYGRLLKRYSLFVTPTGEYIERTPRMAEYTTVCVMTCLSFQMISQPDEFDTPVFRQALKEILKLIGNHPVHVHLYRGQRNREEEMERRGELIERVPWLEDQTGVYDQKKRKSEPSLLREGDKSTLFYELFKIVDISRWTAFVTKCESELTFANKIDRFAYLIFAVQKDWIKSPKSVNCEKWTLYMNSLVARNVQMQVSEVGKKYSAVVNKEWFGSYSKLYDTYTCSGIKDWNQAFFNKLRSNVEEMCKIEKKL